MAGIHILVLSVVCIIAGVVLSILRLGDASAIMLVTAGTGSLATSVVSARSKAAASAKRELEAMEETQVLRRELKKVRKQ